MRESLSLSPPPPSPFFVPPGFAVTGTVTCPSVGRIVGVHLRRALRVRRRGDPDLRLLHPVLTKRCALAGNTHDCQTQRLAPSVHRTPPSALQTSTK